MSDVPLIPAVPRLAPPDVFLRAHGIFVRLPDLGFNALAAPPFITIAPAFIIVCADVAVALVTVRGPDIERVADLLAILWVLV